MMMVAITIMVEGKAGVLVSRESRVCLPNWCVWLQIGLSTKKNTCNPSTYRDVCSDTIKRPTYILLPSWRWHCKEGELHLDQKAVSSLKLARRTPRRQVALGHPEYDDCL